MVQKGVDIIMEFVSEKERNLRNLKQIGTPKEKGKIYVENLVYTKIKENSYKEKRVFVLMGHTEKMEGGYVTFIEGVIPVREINFQGNIPCWNNSTWSEIFKEIRYCYEDMIMVGWAVDVKGMSLKVTPELERVHREHFGGVHQLLFLLDTMEQEETFYIYKENKIVPKDGFYIYHKAQRKNPAEYTGIKRDNGKIDLEVDVRKEQGEERKWQGGRYRQLVNEKKTIKTSESGNLGIGIAIAMLLFVIGVGVYEDRDKLWNVSDSVPSNAIQEQQDENLQTGATPEVQESDTETEKEEMDVSTIPVDVISGSEQQE